MDNIIAGARHTSMALIIIMCALVVSMIVGVRPAAAAANIAPTVTLAASATSINAGQPVTLTWTTTDADSCSGTGFPGSSIYGSYNVAPVVTTAYSITCMGKGGSATASVNINVAAASGTPSVSLVANPAAITEGSISSLTWDSANVTSCTGTGFTSSATKGATNVSPAVATTYTISCTGTTGQTSASVTLNVNPVVPPTVMATGTRVRATASLNVRSKPNNGAKNVVCTQPAGTFGTITEGPVRASGNTWWNVSYDSGCSGWSVQDYLTTTLTAVPKASQLAAVAAAISSLTTVEQQLQTLLAQVQHLIAALRN